MVSLFNVILTSSNAAAIVEKSCVENNYLIFVIDLFFFLLPFSLMTPGVFP